MDITSYLLGKKAGGGGGTVNLQEKDVTITTNTTTKVQADEGYDGLKDVDITTNVPGVDEYFNTNPTTVSGDNWLIKNYFKSFADITIPTSTTSLPKFLSGWTFATAPKIIFGDNVTSLYRLCHLNAYIQELDTSGFTGTNLTSLSEVFNGCQALKSIDLSNISPSGTLSMYSAFQDCYNIKTIDLSGLESVTSIRLSFYNCNNLNRLDIRKMLLTNTTNHDNTFNGVPTSCLIIVKDATQKAWMNTNFSSYTNVKTPEEL